MDTPSANQLREIADRLASAPHLRDGVILVDLKDPDGRVFFSCRAGHVSFDVTPPAEKPLISLSGPTVSILTLLLIPEVEQDSLPRIFGGMKRDRAYEYVHALRSGLLSGDEEYLHELAQDLGWRTVVFESKPVDAPPELMRWLVGSEIESIEVSEEELWDFEVRPAGSFQTQNPWRLLRGDVLEVTSSEHGHQYGLPEPINSAKLTKSKVSGLAIESVTMPAKSGDLILTFEEGFSLEIRALFRGYDSWHAIDPEGNRVSMNGIGKATLFTY